MSMGEIPMGWSMGLEYEIPMGLEYEMVSGGHSGVHVEK